LDLESMTDGVIPELITRHFGGLDCDVVIVDRERRDRVVFGSSPQIADADVTAGDFETPIFEIRIDPEMLLERREGAGPGPPRRRGMIGPRRRPPPRGPGDQPSFSESRPGARMGGPQGRGGGNAAWLLVVTHRAGSLEEAVSGLRRRNLGISGGILLLLAASIVMIVVSTRRAQWFARRQLEFVSGVSHELKTPLAAIRSAAENLAEGVVTEPAKVREYGELVDREGRRLGRLVGEILELAGMQGRQKEFPRGPVAVDQLVAGALADTRWSLESHEIEVVEDIPADLPDVSGDPEALRRAVVNLVDNAVKHGGRRTEITVRATLGGAGREVLLTVADRGPGIHRADLPHIFEPFYRGRNPAARAGGSGLGLSLVKHIVERHGGRVTVETGRDGTGVTLYLPVGPADGESSGPQVGDRVV
jgi:signal transduction histidine kinase